MMNNIKSLIGTAAILLVSLSANATDFNGSKTLICSLTEAAECYVGLECNTSSVASVNLPNFVQIDFKKKIITSKDPSMQVKTSGPAQGNAKIRHKENLDGMLLLQGSRNGRAWSIAINEKTGRMTIAAATNESGFVVQGACIVK